MKTRSTSHHTSWRTLCATFCVVVILAGVSRADIKLTCEVTATRGSASGSFQETVPSQQTVGPGAAMQATPVSVTISYRGQVARTEVTGGPVALYDGAAGKVYALDLAQKTYRVLSVPELLNRPDVLQAQGQTADQRTGRALRFDTSVRLVKTDETKTVAGRKTQRYLLTASMSMQAPRNSGRGPGGGFPRGGFPLPRGRRRGFPLGTGRLLRDPGPGAESDPRDAAGRQPLVEVKGEYWLTDATLLPAGAKSPLLPLLRQTITTGPLLKELSDRMTKLKLIPLAGQVTVTVRAPSPEPQGPLTTIMETRTITEGALDGALFKVPPDGYRETKPSDSPALQQFGRLPGGGPISGST